MSSSKSAPSSTSDLSIRARLSSDLAVYALVAFLVGLSWLSARRGWLRLWEPGWDGVYWSGVIGSSMMLFLVTLYPLRKHARFAMAWGRMKWWFLAHVFFGLGGPFVILAHSEWRLRSLNASVALISMAIVALSGVVGRFLYARAHRGFVSRGGDLRSLRESILASGSSLASSREALEPIESFESWSGSTLPSWLKLARLSAQRRSAFLASESALRAALKTQLREQPSSRATIHDQQKQSHDQLLEWLDAIDTRARASAYEHLLAQWHIAHLPFVIMMVIAALIHILAVHMY